MDFSGVSAPKVEDAPEDALSPRIRGPSTSVIAPLRASPPAWARDIVEVS